MRRAVLALALLLGLTGCLGTPSDIPGASCDRSGSCTDIPLDQVEAIADLDLPDGTEVLDSSYDRFQDWHLSATLRLPEGAPSPIADSPYDWDDGVDDDGIHRSAAESDEDGRTILQIEVFTT